MGASVVTGVDAPPVLEPAEHILNFVTLAIELSVMFDWYFPIGFRRNARRDAALGESLAEPAGVIPLVAEEIPGSRQRGEHRSRTFEIARLAFAQQHDQRSPIAITHGVQFRVQAALGAADTSGNRPFFKRLAAVRCAFRWVASIISRCGLLPLRASAAKILLKIPSRLQRTKRL
jgi:hypothetical protein